MKITLPSFEQFEILENIFEIIPDQVKNFSTYYN